MIIVFNKNQVTGNDFIIIEDISGSFNPDDASLIRKLCYRRFGNGADRLIHISSDSQNDFEMKYFNSDGF